MTAGLGEAYASDSVLVSIIYSHVFFFETQDCFNAITISCINQHICILDNYAWHTHPWWPSPSEIGIVEAEPATTSAAIVIYIILSHLVSILFVKLTYIVPANSITIFYFKFLNAFTKYSDQAFKICFTFNRLKEYCVGLIFFLKRNRSGWGFPTMMFLGVWIFQ